MKIIPKKILIINQFGIGDVLFTMPVVNNLKKEYPSAEIFYLCNNRVVGLLNSEKNIDKTFVYDRDEYNAIYKKSKFQFFKKVVRFISDIRREEFDIVFDFSLNSMFGLFTFFAGIKERIGFNYKKRSPFLTKKFTLEGFSGQHVVEFYLDLIRASGIDAKTRELSIQLNSKDIEWAKCFLSENNISKGSPIIGVLPGAGASWGADAKYRRWPRQRFVKLVDKMIENLSAQIILMGDVNEAELCSEIVNKWGSRVLPACGKTTIAQLGALLSLCDLAVLNDGGPLHLSVAVGIKTVSIFGPVDERVYGPFGNSEDHCVINSGILCRPCYRNFRMVACQHSRCLQDISVDDVFDGVKKILKA